MPRPTVSLPILPVLRHPAAIPQGPKLYRQPVQHAGGPGQVPPGFLGNRNSALEWIAYWALAKAFGNPPDPRAGPPFDGGFPDWTYQEPESQGAGLIGSVIDFVVYNPGRGASPIAIRIQTEFFHTFADAEKQAYDELQRYALENYADVVDVYDTDLVGDPTGAKAVVAMKRAAGLIEPFNPIGAGTALRATRVQRLQGPR